MISTSIATYLNMEHYVSITFLVSIVAKENCQFCIY